MTKDEIIEKLNALEKALLDNEWLQQSDIVFFIVSALQSSVVLTIKQADALLNDDGNENQAAVDEVERQLAAIEAMKGEK